MIAVIVSKENDCSYCISHHSEALLHFWKDQEKIDLLISDYKKVELKEIDVHLCTLAEILTDTPNSPSKEKNITKLKEAGLSDRGILDATLIIGYFNFVNRIVLGLGVQLEMDSGGYKYE